MRVKKLIRKINWAIVLTIIITICFIITAYFTVTSDIFEKEFLTYEKCCYGNATCRDMEYVKHLDACRSRSCMHVPRLNYEQCYYDAKP